MFDTVGLDGFVNTKERNRLGVSLSMIFGIGIYTLIITHAIGLLRDPDTFWHIAVGRWIIEHTAVPTHGIFSATMANAPWVDQQWLAEVLMAWGYDHFGWWGLAIGTALCEAAAIAILLRVLLGSLPPVYAMFATTLAVVLWFPHVLARPYILTTPILVIWVAALVQARTDDRAPSPWLALLIVLWANLHGSFVFGIGVAALFAAEAVLLAPDWQARVRTVRDWGFFGLACVGAATLTPYGFKGLLFPLHLINMSALIYIGEWQGVDFSKSGGSSLSLLIWLLTVLFAALTLGWRLPPTRVGILLVLLTMALKHLRYMELLGPVSALILAPSLASFVRQSVTSKGDRLMDELALPANRRGSVISAVLILTVTAFAVHGKLSPPDVMTPAAAMADARSHGIKGPVFNSYKFGGYLIFSGTEPFIDGRVELYGNTFVKRFIDAVWLTNDQLPKLLDEYGITWTVLEADTSAVTLMDHLPGWRRLYQDSIAVVHVRQTKGG
jgi:hypothetical protein